MPVDRHGSWSEQPCLLATLAATAASITTSQDHCLRIPSLLLLPACLLLLPACLHAWQLKCQTSDRLETTHKRSMQIITSIQHLQITVHNVLFPLLYRLQSTAARHSALEMTFQARYACCPLSCSWPCNRCNFGTSPATPRVSQLTCRRKRQLSRRLNTNTGHGLL